MIKALFQHIFKPKFRKVHVLSCNRCETTLDHDEDPVMIEYPQSCFNCGSKNYNIASRVQKRRHRFQLWR